MNTPGPNSWTTTKLAERLQALAQLGEDESQAWALAKRHLPRIEGILSKGGTSPEDFTLHDEGHAYRVAEWMFRVTPDKTFQAFSGYEILFLLFAAYLHDVGMTPEQGKLSRHRRHLLFPVDADSSRDWLSAPEATALQSWLDAEGRGIIAPITNGKAAEADLRLAHELLTHYSRYRHNDWSAEFIETLFGSETLPHYDSWRSDLITICRSHHEGYEELSSSRFTPRPAGSRQVVHLRYLACVLRIADILDVDPERTPEVIFRHRSIAPGSELHWRKDHVTWLHLDASHGQITLVARPSRAVLEKAIRDTAEAIQTELQLAARIAREQPFEHCVFAAAPLTHYVWSLPAWLTIDVRAANEEYTYIDGAFRPNTERLLSLFGGTALYSSQFDAVRELLQNAFDAVREAIGYEWLADAAQTPNLADLLRSKHQVQLRLDADGPAQYLVCTDTGVGMTREIIENHVLVSGTGERREILELERACLAGGFPIERTGRFGIGVLAYFMIASEATLTTRRHQLAPGEEGHGWVFESTGVGSFGELRKNDRKMPGTEVRLRLRLNPAEDPTEWFHNLRAYLVKTLIFLPCRLQLSTTLPGARSLTLEPGWTIDPIERVRSAVSRSGRIASQQEELVSTATAKVEETKRQEMERGLENADRLADWLIDEGELPEKMGRYRLLLPFFKLDSEVCIAFLDVSKTDRGILVNSIAGFTYLLPRPLLNVAWRGMAVVGFANTFERCLVEIDLTHIRVGELKINRSYISPNEATQRQIQDFLRERERHLFDLFLKQHQTSSFDTLSRMLLHHPREGLVPYWLESEDAASDEKRLYWRPISYPATSARLIERRWPYPVPEKIYRSDGEIHILPEVVGPGEYGSDTYDLGSLLSIPKLLFMTQVLNALPVWDADSFAVSPPLRWLRFGRFPPNSPVIASASYLEEDVHWNVDHPVVRKITVDAYQWAADQFRTTLNPLKLRDEILADATKASAWIVKLFGKRGPFGDERKRQKEVWIALLERDPEFLTTLWNLTMDIKREDMGRPLIMLWHGQIDVVERTGWQTMSPYSAKKELAELVPTPPLEWRSAASVNELSS